MLKKCSITLCAAVALLCASPLAFSAVQTPELKSACDSAADGNESNLPSDDCLDIDKQVQSAQIDKMLSDKDALGRLKSTDDVVQMTGRDRKNLKDSDVDKAKDLEKANSKPLITSTVNQYFQKFGLKPFGYEMFRSTSTALVPGTDLPTPDNYKLEPGDSLTVETYGQVNKTFQLPIEKDGVANLPDIGPLPLGGMELGVARSLLEAKVRNSMVATNARVSVSQLRASKVIVVGDAEKPGSYVLSGIPTVTAALFASGGVKDIGSLRKIELKRDGKLIRTLDIYAELLSGDTSKDTQVFPGDAIFVPVVGPTIGVRGEVYRPAIYELLNERTIEDAIKLAGGFSPNSDIRHATIDRITNGSGRTVESIDLSDPRTLSMTLRAGDLLHIPPINPYLDNTVEVFGAILRPISRGFRPGLKILDVISSPSETKVSADLGYVLVERVDSKDHRVSTVSTDLNQAFKDPKGPDNIALERGDKIYVFDKNEPRSRYLAAIVKDIQRQAGPSDNASVVDVSGQVNAPGTYPLDRNMRLKDLIRAGGGLKDSAYTEYAELTRYQIVNGERRVASISKVKLSDALNSDASANLVLQPYDSLLIQTVPDWSKNETVELIGEFRFPGRYVLRNGETLSQLIQRAGGFTERAFLQGGIFTREDIRQREVEQKNRMIQELTKNLVSEKTDSKDKKMDSALDAQSAIDQLSSVVPLGRIVIDLPGLNKLGRLSDCDVTLRDKDKLIVPRKTEEISVIGEVHNQTSFLFRPGLTKKSIIEKAGGYTSRADKKSSYIIRANGEVVPERGFFAKSGRYLEPGDSVVVPINVDRVNPLIEWSTISQVVYQFAVTASSLKVIGVL